MKRRLLPSVLTFILFSSLPAFSQPVWIPKAENVLPPNYEITNTSIVDDQIIWVTAMDWTALYNSPVSFSRALKRHTGLRTPKLYRMAYDSLASAWKAEQKQLTPTHFTKINKRKRQVTNYTFPRPLSDGSLVCVRESFDKISNLVLISPKGKERRLTTQGIVIDNYISVVNDKIAWLFTTSNAWLAIRQKKWKPTAAG